MSRIGIISDTHDRLDKVRSAVALFNRLKPDRVVHCGDVVAQFVLSEMRSLSMPVSVVFGNCDGDRVGLRRRAAELGFASDEGPLGFEQGGRRFVVSHQLRHEGSRPVIINPGEACGWLFGRSTAALLDTETAEVEVFDL
ncbi:YfcE family phosphodiesterase [candidate division WOR-3 bacterium]|uniref:Phosphoesterase n=1 Tax=candidate division WOR-3 bacterium TaxID=2052148 RepID=A0A938BQ21_UNCW3|nr:YfcE family phosphodiesterase [candidate division WOR-3 bacterium]